MVRLTRALRYPKRLGRALTEMHSRLRNEGDTPLRTACAVGLGVFIGCIPVYGAHFLLCVAFARLFGLNRITTYLAAHINNPFSAPWLLLGELGVGHWLHTGRWPKLSLSELLSAGVWDLGRELLGGAVATGLALGIVLGGATLVLGLCWQSPPTWAQLCEQTSSKYLAAGIAHWEFVRGKLRHDPLYREILTSGLLPGAGTLLDLGCGRGILLALIQTAREQDIPAPPPARLSLEGIEHRPSIAEVARKATGGAHIHVADIRDHPLGPCDAILLLDVLHYLSPAEQEHLVGRAAAALEPGGTLLIREPDRALGVRFLLTRSAERLAAILRLHWRQRFHYRTAAAWAALLERQGLVTGTRPLWGRTPLANVLIHARRPAHSDAAARTTRGRDAGARSS